MGYNTEFEGRFILSKRLTGAQYSYLLAFSETRRMQRNAAQALKLEDSAREAVKLPIGIQGGYYVGDSNVSAMNGNKPPLGQPGLWCNWIPDIGRTADSLVWNGTEKTYDSVEWINYLIQHFFKTWGIELSGHVEYFGEERSDTGKIVIRNGLAVKIPHGADIPFAEAVE